MTQTTILWTVFPKGTSDDGTTLELSILVSPRLDTGSPADLTLSKFPSFADWPKTVKKLELFLKFGDQDPVAATPAPGVPPADSQLWAALFPPDDTVVRSFVPPDFSQLKIHSFPVGHVVDALARAYGTVGVTSPSELPSVAELESRGLTAIRTVEGGDNEWGSLDDQYRALLDARFRGSELPALAPSEPEPFMDFFRAEHFHRFHGGDYAKEPEVPKLDFHESLALLGGHPFLLRRLGLLFDVRVSWGGQSPVSTVRVGRVEHLKKVGFQPLATHYLLDVAKRRFLAIPGPGSDLVGGWLDLASPDYRLEQVDVDGAALAAVRFANQLYMRHRGRRRSLDSPQDDGLPALRGGGISVVRTGRALRQATAFCKVKETNDALDPKDPPALYAEDLTRGYRVDVLDQGVWRSLCRRHACYRVNRLGTVLESPDEEGVVTASAGREAEPEQDFFLHEALFHWDGWSLVAPRPGQAIERDGLSHSEDLDPDGRTRNPSQTSLEVEVTSEAVPGTLPRLRWGRSYRLRVRAVDAAGNSPPLDSDDDCQASAPIVYRRFEPVEAPAVVIVSGISLSGLPGESAMRPVIRSYNFTPAEDTVPSVEIAERLLLPPRVAVAAIELYGHLDTAEGTVDSSLETWERLAAQDEVRFPDDDGQSGEAARIDPAAVPAEVPYLADPFAEAAVLRGLPGTDDPYPVSYGTGLEWWQGKPFRLRIQEDTEQPPQWDASERVLTVALPKAAIVRVRLSSKPRPEDLEKLAVWKWIEAEAFDDEELGKLRQLAKGGCHWMLTPFRELVLVHAVQQPLEDPLIETLEPRKEKIGDTFAKLQGTAGVHGASTGKLDLLARWSEPTGYGPAKTERVGGAGHVFDVPVPEQEAASVPWGGRRHEFGDTKYRRVDYYAVATSRFREYFDPKAVATDFVRPAAGEESCYTAEVLNSARPLAPNLLYVVPTFAWKADKDERGTLSRRRGGLRLYLEEPWYSSGDGELLGVVIWPGRGDGCVDGQPPPSRTLGPVLVPDAMKPYASQWGRDPIWLSGPTQQVPSLENFKGAAAVELGLTLAELEGKPNPSTVGVAGYEVGYDDERHLFYCDLEIDAGDSYFPFVRLALARYQPKSIPGAELSRVVVADFAQFAPDRVVWVARQPEDPTALRVVVSGTGYRRNKSFPCTGEVEARLERWLEPGGEEIGWVPVGTAPVKLKNVQALATLAVWEGELTLPPAAPGERFRVVVEEYEAFLGDVPEADLPDEEGGSFGQGRERRLVYSDAVEVQPNE